MKKLLAVVIALLVVALAMALSRPDEASFRRHMEKVSVPEDGNLIDQVRGSLISAQARLTTDYRDYRLWATAEVSRGSRHESYLGLFGIWISTSSDG
jgi:hypothetical protein